MWSNHRALRRFGDRAGTGSGDGFGAVAQRNRIRLSWATLGLPTFPSHGDMMWLVRFVLRLLALIPLRLMHALGAVLGWLVYMRLSARCAPV